MDERPPKLTRLRSLDGLRGVLAVVVVADHAATELGSKALGPAADVSVAVFFVISGLVLTRAWDGDIRHFLLRRFLRLWPVFVVCLLAGSLLAWRRPHPLDFIWIPLPSYDANLLCPPLWSLFLEAWAAPAMPLIVWSARGGVGRTLGCMALCIAAAVAWHPADLFLRAVVSYSVCFVLGARLSGITWHSAVLEARLPQWLGRVSYSLYLSHWLVLRAATAAMGVPGTLIGIPLSFGVAWVIWRWIERPSITLSRLAGSAAASQTRLSFRARGR